MRYPGGTIGNYMDWRTGQFMYTDARDPNKGPVYGTYKGKDHRKIKINTYRPEELKNAIDLNGATPIYMVNMLTDTLGSTLEMLAHCEEIGLPVKYIELATSFILPTLQGEVLKTIFLVIMLHHIIFQLQDHMLKNVING